MAGPGCYWRLGDIPTRRAFPSCSGEEEGQTTRGGSWTQAKLCSTPKSRTSTSCIGRTAKTCSRRSLSHYQSIASTSELSPYLNPSLQRCHLVKRPVALHFQVAEPAEVYRFFTQSLDSQQPGRDCRQLLHLAGASYSARIRSLLLCGSPVIFPYDYDSEPKEFWYHMLKDRHNIIFTGTATALVLFAAWQML